ncbi:MAG TPA: hypothetical protein PLK30_21600 [Blastocatellia bacterium]|nr:hypothetical protein [Blastocatellia bacterium]
MNGAHWHLFLNHLPVLGTFFGILLLLFAWAKNSNEIKRVSLGVFVLTAISAIPAYLTGEPAEEVANRLPGVTHALIEHHEEAALIALSAAVAAGVVALAGLFLSRKAKPLPVWLMLATLFLALATGGLMLRTANLGGEIRHTEIRSGSNATVPAAGEDQQKKNEEEREHRD